MGWHEDVEGEAVLVMTHYSQRFSAESHNVCRREAPQTIVVSAGCFPVLRGAPWWWRLFWCIGWQGEAYGKAVSFDHGSQRLFIRLSSCLSLI
jgi:hypothetical protein